ncbi:hypothetical protein Rs2_12718 [Raphanus sativus]|nr:hypothetical protein Rs2_12718 [Raphanus sativus]
MDVEIPLPLTDSPSSYICTPVATPPCRHLLYFLGITILRLDELVCSCYWYVLSTLSPLYNDYRKVRQSVGKWCVGAEEKFFGMADISEDEKDHHRRSPEIEKERDRRRDSHSRVLTV